MHKLGADGMGSVYLAHNLAFDEKVAVKFLSSPALLTRFRVEQETLRLLSDARIVKARGEGVSEDGEHFILMELVAGTPLDALIDEGCRARRLLPKRAPVPPCVAPERVLRVMIDVCIALETAHAHRIIHRDLKPANLVVERSAGGYETTKVLDFGIAKALDGHVHSSDAEPATITGMIIGTVACSRPRAAT